MSAISYETVFIAEPEIPADQVDQLVHKMKETIASHKGEVKSEDRWGRRRLAYPIRGHREGFYSVVTFTAEPTVVGALEHLFNVTDTVIRQLTIRHYPSKKKFPPRRVRPAGEAAHRGPGRGPAGMRPRTEPTRPSTPSPAAVEPPSATSGLEAPAPQGEQRS